MRFFLLFVFFLYGPLLSAYISAYSERDIPCDTIRETYSFNETFSPLATLFCEKQDSRGNCIYFDEDPGVFKEATVRVSGSGYCSGSVIELTRFGYRCETPFLMTAGHCADPKKIANNLRLGNHKIKRLSGFYEVKKGTLQSLQTKCVLSEKEENCLLTPQHILDDDNKWNLTGVDQALIPLTGYASNLPRIKVDLNSLLNEDELTECFKKDHKATMVSYLSWDHLEKIGKSKDKTGKDEDHIKAESCNNLSWLPKNNYTIKPRIGHRCATLKGMSGSFFRMSCEGQTGLFLHQGQIFQGVGSVKERAKAGKNIYPSEYKGKEQFKNKATYVDPRLLELYAEHYCNFPPMGA